MGCLSDTHGLNWLIILYFQLEGLIPKTKVILKQPHSKFLFKEVDIGFADSEDFANSWRVANGKEKVDTDKEKFAHEVFLHFYKFCLFCTSIEKKEKKMRRIIIDTCHGEIIPIAELLETGTVEGSELEQNELDKIKESLEKENNNDDKIVMIHPFFFDRRISLSNAKKVFGDLKETGLKLKEYLELEEEGMIKKERLSSEEFLKLLKLEN